MSDSKFLTTLTRVAKDAMKLSSIILNNRVLQFVFVPMLYSWAQARIDEITAKLQDCFLLQVRFKQDGELRLYMRHKVQVRSPI